MASSFGDMERAGGFTPAGLFCAAVEGRLEPLPAEVSAGHFCLTVAPFRVRAPHALSKDQKEAALMGCFFLMVRHEGLEPLTFAFVVRYSIQLS